MAAISARIAALLVSVVVAFSVPPRYALIAFSSPICVLALLLSNVSEGATTDSSNASTQIGLLKAIKAYLGGTLNATTTETNSAAILADIAAMLALQGTSGDANTVNSFMGRLTKIRDLLNATLTIQGTIT